MPKEFLSRAGEGHTGGKDIPLRELGKFKNFFIRFCLLTFTYANQQVPEFFNSF
jgi:hypothetical protein